MLLNDDYLIDWVQNLLLKDYKIRKIFVKLLQTDMKQALNKSPKFENHKYNFDSILVNF